MQRHRAVLLGVRVEQRKNAGTYAQEDVRSAGLIDGEARGLRKRQSKIRADGERSDGRNHFC
jgi:hypothetical protein